MLLYYDDSKYSYEYIKYRALSYKIDFYDMISKIYSRNINQLFDNF